MYVVAKGLQLAGLIVVAVGFVVRFPALMEPRWLLGGITISGCGWIMQRYLLRGG